MALVLKNLLNDSIELRAVIGKAQSLYALQQRFIAVAPANIAPYCQVTSLESGVLTIVSSNAIMAAKLRQLAPQVVSDMQKGGSQVSGIQVKVQVSYPRPGRAKPARRLSPRAQDALNEFGVTLMDSPLKEAIRKLGNKR